jgi:hypothetical protein
MLFVILDYVNNSPFFEKIVTRRQHPFACRGYRNNNR